MTIPTARDPWTVTLAYTPDQNGGRVSVMPHRSPVFAILSLAAVDLGWLVDGEQLPVQGPTFGFGAAVGVHRPGVDLIRAGEDPAGVAAEYDLPEEEVLVLIKLMADLGDYPELFR